ncbi:hypothetical protein [Vibrio coralliilyticus]|uniref:hypothetical protein n=1 Tax=Vibrio coralliilyticus TaxID=190893 RepID=UPI002FD3AB8F
MDREFYEVTENYLTSTFHFFESDHRTFDIVYDDITSFSSKIKITTTSSIDLDKLKSFYRYADGFLIDSSYVESLASLDCYNISLIPVEITDNFISIDTFYYMKVHSVINCVNFNKSQYHQEGDVISFQSISIVNDKIGLKDRVFFIDDEYSILMDNEVLSIFNQDNEVIVNSVNNIT